MIVILDVYQKTHENSLVQSGIYIYIFIIYDYLLPLNEIGWDVVPFRSNFLFITA